MKVPFHIITTANLGAAYPFISDEGLPVLGAYIGQNLLGGHFAYDPFELYNRSLITNPNMIVLGQIGRGKSSFIKSYIWRQSVFGKRAWVIDPKGEYGDLAAAFSVKPIALRPGGHIRLNPLDFYRVTPSSTRRKSLQSPGVVSGHCSDGCHSVSVGLISSLASTCLGRPLNPREKSAIEAAVRTAEQGSAQVPTLNSVVTNLFEPSADSAEELRSSRRSLAEDGRDVALELRRLVDGELKGMFDGPTTEGLDLDMPLVVLDLSAVYGSPMLGMIMICAMAWLRSWLDYDRSVKTIFVVDEAWAVLMHVETARWLQSLWKLARSYGVSNIAVVHRASDLTRLGGERSEQSGLGTGLLADSETRVIYGQSPLEVQSAQALLGLNSKEAELLSRLGRGIALWKIGDRSFLVKHVLAEGERHFVNTDAAMRGTASLVENQYGRG